MRKNLLHTLAPIPATAAALLVAAALAGAATAAPNPPPIFPALAGVVRDACTGLPIFGASETLVPLSGQVPPSPIRVGGLFAYPALEPGAYALGVAAPGYRPILTSGSGDQQPGILFQPTASPSQCRRARSCPRARP